MAAPAEKTLKNLSGKWVMNKSLSDDIDRILQMQNVGWFLRKLITAATITLTISEYTSSPDNLTHIDISQVATGGVSGTTEKRTLDWSWRDHTDGVFGTVRGRSRWCRLDEVDDNEWLRTGWLDPGGEFVQSYVESRGGGWTADQVWGFEMVDGRRYHVRHVVVRKGEDWKEARLVYDYQGSAAAARKDDDDGLAYGD